MELDTISPLSPTFHTSTQPTALFISLSHPLSQEPPSEIPSLSRNSYTFPEGGPRAWLVTLGSFTTLAATFGLVGSVGLFQSYWSSHQLSAYASRDIGWIAAIGPLFDRFGPKWLMLGGSVVYVASLVVLAECRTYWSFMLVYGVCAGMSGAFLTTTALAVVAHWFERRRGLASGVAFVGSSAGGIGFPLMLNPVLKNLGWAWGIRIVALVVFLLLIVGNMCIRGRLPSKKNGGAMDLRCFLDSRFSWATVGIACFEFVLFGALGLLPTYALGQGFSTQMSFNVVAMLNAGSALGRSFSGFIADRIGRFNTMLLNLSFTLIVTFGLWFPFGHNLVAFCIFATLFGLGSGSVISMAPVCLGQLCKADEYGQYYGTSYSVVAFATLICIPIGGELLPTIGSSAFVAFFGGVLVLSLISLLMSRWACLEYSWKWIVKV